MVVDCHVHTRDFDERHKETIAHALTVAEKAGVSAIFAMPNTKPSLVDEESVLKYLRLADEAHKLYPATRKVEFRAYLALTSNREQVLRAIETKRKHTERIAGFKIYGAHSTNNIGVIEEGQQRRIFTDLKSEEYAGVVAIHPEKQALMNDKAFDFADPVSHATLARPEKSEISSVNDFIRYARESGFEGRLHFAHISSPIAVGLIVQAKKAGLNVSCGVTPHHLLYDWTQMQQPDGHLYKMNPPLREPGKPGQLLDMLRRGDIDFIETDHAPHTRGEKDSHDACPSGVPALHAWPLVIKFLRMNQFTEEAIVNVTHWHVLRRFGGDVRPLPEGMYDRDAYEFNVWRGLEKRVGIEA